MNAQWTARENRRYDHIPVKRVAITFNRSTNLLLVDGEQWGDSRIGAAVLNYTRSCRCQRCTSCQAGKWFINRP